MTAIIGALGTVPFYVGEDAVQTLRDMKWNSSASYAVHERHGGRPLKEFTGPNGDEIQFVIRLSAFLGINPHDAINELFYMERNGVAAPLCLGTKGYGIYRWVITSTKRGLEVFDKYGNLMTADVTVALSEYTNPSKVQEGLPRVTL